MSLSVKLLGEFELQSGTGVRLTLPTRKTRALFAYLLANADAPQPRERLMDLLWSERGEQQARHSLNQALLAIRKLAAANDPPLGEEVVDDLMGGRAQGGKGDAHPAAAHRPVHMAEENMFQVTRRRNYLREGLVITQFYPVHRRNTNVKGRVVHEDINRTIFAILQCLTEPGAALSAVGPRPLPRLVGVQQQELAALK